MDSDDQQQRRIFLWVCLLNVGLFLGLGLGGIAADSSALLANAVDNASDGAVYIISFLAVGRPPVWKKRAATASGVLLILFAVGVLVDVARRFFTGTEPIGPAMIAMSIVAAIVNAWCLVLLKRIRASDVNVRAAETFSWNDFIANGGALVAGGLVVWLNQPWPDLVVGGLVAVVAFAGALEILRDVRSEKARETRS